MDKVRQDAFGKDSQPITVPSETKEAPGDFAYAQAITPILLLDLVVSPISATLCALGNEQDPSSESFWTASNTDDLGFCRE